jgi:hypothetical protein
MIFNRHSALAGQHAFLSASKYSWLNYDEDKLEAAFNRAEAAAKGSRLHALAHMLIQEGEKLPRNEKTLNLYVNDAVGFRMVPEQVLFYSINCFGTADAISFRRNVLRISDLKTGERKCSHNQLMIYAALFCLEYGHRPFDIGIELRIYQNGAVDRFDPTPEEIAFIMDRIITFDKYLNNLREELEA